MDIFCVTSRKYCQPSKESVTMLLEWNQTRPILCTKHPNLTMLFYYLKVPACYCPHSSTLELNGALKWGTVWTSISIGIETRKGQIQKLLIYLMKNMSSTLTVHNSCASWGRSSYSTSSVGWVRYEIEATWC